MSNYTIQDFWKPRLAGLEPAPAKLIRGWSLPEGLVSFKEAPLTLSTEFNSDSSSTSGPIILVSAPGAVGKSTLARQIAHVTGAIYFDLAGADPVGANTLSGGLVKSGLYPKWSAGTAAILIDGLDEARLRVTQEAFEAFLADVAEASKGRNLPTVLFGRTGAIQDAWLVLADKGIEAAVLEIGYYDAEASVEFAEARLRVLKPLGPHSAAEKKAVELLLNRLRAQTESDGDRFAGYAPVLQAVADRVAQEGNPGALVAQIEKGAQPVTLQTVVLAILNRERSKLNGLPFENQQLAQTLYLPDEQLDRLVSRIYQLPSPDLPAMGAKDAQTYSTALGTWVAEHPFLDGGSGVSSAVFEAMISTRALKNPAASQVAIQRELRRGAAANPFLSEFYLTEDGSTGRMHLPPEHIGIVYSSLRARLSIGDTASLLVEGSEDAQEENALQAEVEITLARRNADRARVLLFDTEQIGVLRLGAYVEDVDLTVPNSRVEIGPGPEAVLIAPISVQCEHLVLTTEKIIVESSPGKGDASVFLEADSFDGGPMTAVPAIRSNSSLRVSWPGARTHPWTSFARQPTPVGDPRIDEALRRFRKFVIAFRSHSKGNLARFKDKIEHARMTKGLGEAVLKFMVAEGILSLNGTMYFLDPDRLGEKSGATYADCMARNFSPKTIDFIKGALV